MFATCERVSEPMETEVLGISSFISMSKSICGYILKDVSNQHCYKSS